LLVQAAKSAALIGVLFHSFCREIQNCAINLNPFPSGSFRTWQGSSKYIVAGAGNICGPMRQAVMIGISGPTPFRLYPRNFPAVASETVVASEAMNLLRPQGTAEDFGFVRGTADAVRAIRFAGAIIELANAAREGAMLPMRARLPVENDIERLSDAVDCDCFGNSSMVHPSFI
jgi:hypothetical protein